jgi:hypothetical protein
MEVATSGFETSWLSHSSVGLLHQIFFQAEIEISLPPLPEHS